MINTTEAFVQIIFNHSNGCNSGSLILPEGLTAEQMAGRLSKLKDYYNMTVKQVVYQKEKTESDYQKEWMAAVASGSTTDGLMDWYRTEYGQ